MAKNKNADSIQIARKYLDSLVVEGRILGAVHPTSKVTVLGTEFETPIMTGALSHLKGGMAGYAEGAKLAGALCTALSVWAWIWNTPPMWRTTRILWWWAIR